jgi:hypothetical protein
VIRYGVTGRGTDRVGGAPPNSATPREAQARGESWWWDCGRCRCSGKVDLGRLVAQGRGDVGPETMRCANCKSADVTVRITSVTPPGSSRRDSGEVGLRDLP